MREAWESRGWSARRGEAREERILGPLLPNRKVVLHFQRGCRISFLGDALYSLFYTSVS